MQYPIIDNLIYAYQRNGWTGLNISTGKNLLNPLLYDGGVYNPTIGAHLNVSVSDAQLDIVDDSTFSISLIGWQTKMFIFEIPNNENYTFQIKVNGDNVAYTYGFLDDNYNVVTKNIGVTPNINEVYTFSTNNKFFYFTFAPRSTEQTLTIITPQIEKGTSSTSYEPYGQGEENDIFARLKLPLPHYFPHPVIDALISATDGQQTEEENEILRHYLTPLGIGGI